MPYLIIVIYRSLFCLLLSLQGVFAVEITGANGRIVDFAGIFSAKPEGLVCLLAAGKETMEVPWSKFDIERLAVEHPAVFTAYRESQQQGKEILIRLGTYEGMNLPEEWRASLQSLLDEEIALSIYVKRSEEKHIRQYTKLADLWLLGGSRQPRYANYGTLTGYDFLFKTSYKVLFGVFSGYYQEGVNDTHSRAVHELLNNSVQNLINFESELSKLENQSHVKAFSVSPYLHLRLDLHMRDFMKLLKDLRLHVKTVQHTDKEAINRIYDFVFPEE